MKRLMSAAILAVAIGGGPDLATAQPAPVQPASTAPATPAQPQSSKPSCFDSIWDYLKSSVKDCPLSYGPFTLYGNIDLGYGYEQWGAPVGPSAQKPNYFIAHNSRNVHWLWSPNAASVTVLGIKFAQKIAGEWELIGQAEAGFNPYSLRVINGPRSLADNNLVTVPDQRTQGDSSRAGQWDNSQGFVGVSNPVYGTLTFGRTYALSTATVGAYDPVASVAFSQIGGSAHYIGFGVGPTNTINTALTYRLTYHGIRFAAQAQVGAHQLGNDASEEYQLQVGTDMGNLSFDVVGDFARNALHLSSFAGVDIPPGFDPNTILKGTVSNTGGVGLFSRYNWDPFKFYLGYVYSRTVNPSNDFPGGLPATAAGIFVPPGFVNSNNFIVPRNINTVWTGVRYAARPDLDLSAGVYFEHQNNYLPAPSVCTGSGVDTSSSKCAGNKWAYSFMVDYRIVSRVSLYAGAMLSNVSGGRASGFLHSQNVDPTVGIRYRF